MLKKINFKIRSEKFELFLWWPRLSFFRRQCNLLCRYFF